MSMDNSFNSDRETLEIDAPAHTHTRSHEGREFFGCDCHHCESTRQRLKIGIEAMALGKEIVRCDGSCEHWIIDGDPQNGRIGNGYFCSSCYNAHPVVLQELNIRGGR